MKYKVGDVICSIKNSFRTMKVVDIKNNDYILEVIKNDKPNFPPGKKVKVDINRTDTYTRLYTKLDRALQ